MRYEVNVRYTFRNRAHAASFGGPAPVQETSRFSDNVQAETPEEAALLFEAEVRKDDDVVDVLKVDVKEFDDGFERSGD